MDVAWQCISERLWKCLVSRYGGYFEERYKEAYDDRVYHAKGLDVVAPRLRGPECPVHQPRDQVFWSTTLLDIELNSFTTEDGGTQGLLQC